MVCDAVHARHFVRDPRRNASQDIRREDEPIGGHKVLGLDGAQRDDLLVRPLVAHHAYSLDREEDREGLGDLVVEVGLPNLFDVDAVGVLQDLDLLAVDGAEDADREPGAREGVPLDEVRGDGEEASEGADFICVES